MRTINRVLTSMLKRSQYVDTNEFGNALIKNAFPNSLVFCDLQFALFCPLSKPTQKTLQTEMKMDAIIIRKFCFA